MKKIAYSFFIEHQEASGKECKSLWDLVSLFYDYNVLWIQPDNPNQYCEVISEYKAPTLLVTLANIISTVYC